MANSIEDNLSQEEMPIIQRLKIEPFMFEANPCNVYTTEEEETPDFNLKELEIQNSM